MHHHHQTLSGQDAHDERRRRGALAESTVRDVLYAYRRARIRDPQQDNTDHAIPGTAGWLTGPGRGLDRRFVPLAECRRDIGAPAFMLDTGPILAPDLRADWPDGTTEFIEVKSRDFPWTCKGNRIWMGEHDHHWQSYRKLVGMGLNLSIVFICYGQWLLSKGRPERFDFAVQTWGVWRIGPERIANADLRSDLGRAGSSDQWLELTDAERLPREDEIRLIRTLAYRADVEGIDLMQRIEGTHRAGR